MGNYLNGDTRPVDKRHLFHLLIVCLVISTVLLVGMAVFGEDADGTTCSKHGHWRPCNTTTTTVYEEPTTSTTVEEPTTTSTTMPPSTTTTQPELTPPLVIERELPPAEPVAAEPEFTG